MNLKEFLNSLGACQDSVLWADGREVSEETWNTCPRADWLLWFARQLEIDHRLIAQAAYSCAKTTLIYIPPEVTFQYDLLEVMGRWIGGEVSSEEVKRAKSRFDSYRLLDPKLETIFSLSAILRAEETIAGYAHHAEMCVQRVALAAYYASLSFSANNIDYIPENKLENEPVWIDSMANMSDLVRKSISWQVVEQAYFQKQSTM